jgi:hypothetical protein
MIVQIRGTSGSGKSWVVHNIKQYLSYYFNVEGYSFWEERKRTPSWYEFPIDDSKRKVVLLGQYETNCGGVDNIGASAPRVFPYMQMFEGEGSLVFAEGLLLSEDVIWLEKLKEPVLILHLNTSAVRCYNRIKKRQKESGRGHTDNKRIWRKMETRIKTIERSVERCKKLKHVEVERCSSNEALNRCKEILHEYIVPF